MLQNWYAKMESIDCTGDGIAGPWCLYTQPACFSEWSGSNSGQRTYLPGVVDVHHNKGPVVQASALEPAGRGRAALRPAAAGARATRMSLPQGQRKAMPPKGMSQSRCGPVPCIGHLPGVCRSMQLLRQHICWRDPAAYPTWRQMFLRCQGAPAGRTGPHLRSVISNPSGLTRCSPTEVAAQVLAMLPAFWGISGPTSRTCRSLLCCFIHLQEEDLK